MDPSDEELLKELTPDKINNGVGKEVVERLFTMIKFLAEEKAKAMRECQELEAEIKRLKRTQGLDQVKGKRQKPLNYMPNKDKI